MVKMFYKDKTEAKGKITVPKSVCDELWKKLTGGKQ